MLRHQKHLQLRHSFKDPESATSSFTSTGLLVVLIDRSAKRSVLNPFLPFLYNVLHLAVPKSVWEVH